MRQSPIVRFQMHSPWLFVAILTAWLSMLMPVIATGSPPLGQEVEGLLQVVSVTGYESAAMQYIRQRLDGLPSTVDALGNLTVRLGAGPPRRLIACRLDEPGYVVSHIREDGYLRLNQVGRGPESTLWDQSYAGQEVVMVTKQGLVPGAIGVKSIHLAHQGDTANTPFTIDQAFVDIGAETVAEVQELGLRLLDPVALQRRTVRFRGGLFAASAARSKAACMAMVHAARRVARAADHGTVVFAWTVLGGMGGRGLEGVIRHHGPFDEAVLLSNGFAGQHTDGNQARTALPAPGSGLLAAGYVPPGLPQAIVSPHTASSADLSTSAAIWGSARLSYLGLPARYRDTPVELIDLADVVALVEALVVITGGNAPGSVSVPILPPPPVVRESTTGHDAETLQVLGDLVSRYGVSGAEQPVREQIRALLPAWARPRLDAKGNLLLTFGSGTEHVVFVAHMDEIGFQIASVLDDGRLLVHRKGGFYASLWEAQAGLVHTAQGPLPAVFEPRPDWHTTQHQVLPGSLTVFVGAGSRQEAEALGIRAGQTITMPKRIRRLGKHRILARSLDDRVGCSVLLQALRHIQPTRLTRRLTFAWVVQEEVGLAGSRHLAAALSDVTRVYPVDTFVSSDAPLESPRFAFAPLGRGAVIRAMDSGNVAPRSVVEEILGLAQTHGIPIQYGMTGGWSDGTPFLANGVVNVPLSWPGRYSHSPVEVADLRDIEALARLIATLAVR